MAIGLSRNETTPIARSATANRVVVVARRFWPSGSSETAWRAMRLVRHLAMLPNWNVRVVTPMTKDGGSSPTWTYRGVDLSRPITMPRSEWMLARYTRQWQHWFDDHTHDADVYIAVGARDEAVAMVGSASRRGVASIVSPVASGPESDIAHWRSTKSRHYVAALRRADTAVADDQMAARMLVAAGFPSSNVVAPAPDMSIDASRGEIAVAAVTRMNRLAARRVLGSVNSDLIAADDQAVILTTAAMVRGGPIESFCEALMAVSAAHPAARFWIIGDGPARTRIYNTIRGNGLRSVIAMPGTFNDSIDLLTAADVYLHLDPVPTLGWFSEAVAAGIPMVIADTPRNRAAAAMVSKRVTIRFCQLDPPAIKTALRAAIIDVSPTRSNSRNILSNENLASQQFLERLLTKAVAR